MANDRFFKSKVIRILDTKFDHYKECAIKCISFRDVRCLFLSFQSHKNTLKLDKENLTDIAGIFKFYFQPNKSLTMALWFKLSTILSSKHMKQQESMNQYQETVK